MTVTITNANFKSSMDRNINLKELQLLIPDSKYYTHPQQLVIKSNVGVVILFRNGKMRMMGCKNRMDALFLASMNTMLIDEDFFPIIELQSMTVKVVLDHSIDLPKLSKLLGAQYEPEIFPAVLIRKYKPLSINVFSTGKIIMCGVKQMSTVNEIMSELGDALHYSSRETINSNSGSEY